MTCSECMMNCYLFTIHFIAGKSCEVKSFKNGFTSPLNGVVEEDQEIRFFCNKGYKLYGFSSAMCKEGELDERIPQCIEVSGNVFYSNICLTTII